MSLPGLFVEYERAKESLAASIRRQLAPLFKPGDNLDLTVTVRGGKLRVRMESVSKDPTWKDASA